jgi:hypothetical protein
LKDFRSGLKDFRSGLKVFTDFGINSHPFLSTNEKTNLLYLTYYNIFLVLLSGLDVLGGLGGFGDDDKAEAGALGVEGSGGVESLHVGGWLLRSAGKIPFFLSVKSISIF